MCGLVMAVILAMPGRAERLLMGDWGTREVARYLKKKSSRTDEKTTRKKKRRSYLLISQREPQSKKRGDRKLEKRIVEQGNPPC